MPIDRRAQLSQAEKDAQDYLTQFPAQSDAAIDATGKAIDVSRDTFGKSIKNTADQAAAQYGLPSLPSGPAVDYQKQGLDLQNKTDLAKRRVGERQANMNRTYNSIFNSMVRATGDVNAAHKNAMEWALNQDKQVAESNAGAVARDVGRRNMAIQAAADQNLLNMRLSAAQQQRSRAILNSMVKTFFGMAGSIGTAYALGPAAAAPIAAKTAMDISGDFADNSNAV